MKQYNSRFKPLVARLEKLPPGTHELDVAEVTTEFRCNKWNAYNQMRYYGFEVHVHKDKYLVVIPNGS